MFVNRKKLRDQLIVDIFANTSQEPQFVEASTRHSYLNNERALRKIFIFDDLA